jgi:hypothetical protein
MRFTMKIEEVPEHFKRLGLRKIYRPCQEPESGAILLRVRRPAQIEDGRLQGSEIDLYDADTFRVWTCRRMKAKAMAVRHGLKVRLLDGEAELFVPAALADTILPAFGAKTKRELTMEQLNALKLRWEQARNRPNLKNNPLRNALPAGEAQRVGS